MNFMILIKTKLILISICVLLFSIVLMFRREQKQEEHMKSHELRHLALDKVHRAYHEALDALRKLPDCVRRRERVIQLGHQYIALQHEVYGDSKSNFNTDTLDEDLDGASSSVKRRDDGHSTETGSKVRERSLEHEEA